MGSCDLGDIVEDCSGSFSQLAFLELIFCFLCFLLHCCRLIIILIVQTNIVMVKLLSKQT